MATWAVLKSEIQDDYDLEAEDFADGTQLLTWFNDGIKVVHKRIISIHDKYFETSANLALVSSASEIDLPSNIFANKFTGIFYDNGSEKYEICPLVNLADVMHVQSSDPYQYRIMNSLTANKVKLYPAARESSASNVTAYYIRDAKTITSDSESSDIPEADQFLKQYVVERAKNKERMTPDAPMSQALKDQLDDLVDTLTNMIADENNDVVADFSFYGESV